ncbi:MAG: hypothetical protein AVDCRST_MAG73-1802, partial [uncultured Thermomicrobiales bacterium]
PASGRRHLLRERHLRLRGGGRPRRGELRRGPHRTGGQLGGDLPSLPNVSL